MISAENARYRRVLLQMDASSHCRETLDAAVDIAAHLRADLQGIFVEDSDLVSVGGLDFVREFSFSSATAHALDKQTLDAQLKALAASARRQLEQAGTRRKVTVAFQTVRGDFQTEMANAARDADLIIAEGTGRLRARYYRAPLPGRNLTRRITRPTLLLKGGRPLAKQFTIICHSAESARRCLRAVASLFPDEGRELSLLPGAQGGADAENLAKALAHMVNETGLDARIAAPVSLMADAVLGRLGATDHLLVVADDGPMLRDEAKAHLLFECRHPLLLVQ
ncbi:MAG: hypothetical protein O2967_20940 [Proteobacteria bacterium]|nr:hypothetical protein [Pseudomonadota bacterium]